MPLENRRCLVTGGAGFIGSWWVRHLLAAGHRVTVLDNFATGQPTNVPRAARTVAGDVTDPMLVDRWVRRSDTVFHLAALGDRIAYEDPLTVLTSNLLAALSVIAACAYHDRELVLISSAGVYGQQPVPKLAAEKDPVILPHPWAPPGIYSLTKLVDEALAQTWHSETRLDAKIVRLFPCIGPQQARAYDRLVPRLLLAALKGRPLQIYGDGQEHRSFIYIADAVAAIDLVWRWGSSGRAYNVGSDEAVTVNQLARQILQVTSSAAAIQHLSSEPPLPAPPIPNLQRLHNLGYQPQYDLTEALRAMAAFYQGRD